MRACLWGVNNIEHECWGERENERERDKRKGETNGKTVTGEAGLE